MKITSKVIVLLLLIIPLVACENRETKKQESANQNATSDTQIEEEKSEDAKKAKDNNVDVNDTSVLDENSDISYNNQEQGVQIIKQTIPDSQQNVLSININIPVFKKAYQLPLESGLKITLVSSSDIVLKEIEPEIKNWYQDGDIHKEVLGFVDYQINYSESDDTNSTYSIIIEIDNQKITLTV